MEYIVLKKWKKYKLRETKDWYYAVQGIKYNSRNFTKNQLLKFYR